MMQGPSSREVPSSRLVLLRELALSLSASRAALVALDLSGIEDGTREQINLSHRLAADMAGEDDVPEPDLEMKSEMAQVENEVRQALRLHAALLARVEIKLRVLANMLAGPSVNYSVNQTAAPEHNPARLRIISGKGRWEI
jgi:hypothetical protein